MSQTMLESAAGGFVESTAHARNISDVNPQLKPRTVFVIKAVASWGFIDNPNQGFPIFFQTINDQLDGTIYSWNQLKGFPDPSTHFGFGLAGDRSILSNAWPFSHPADATNNPLLKEMYDYLLTLGKSIAITGVVNPNTMAPDVFNSMPEAGFGATGAVQFYGIKDWKAVYGNFPTNSPPIPSTYNPNTYANAVPFDPAVSDGSLVNLGSVIGAGPLPNAWLGLVNTDPSAGTIDSFSFAEAGVGIELGSTRIPTPKNPFIVIEWVIAGGGSGSGGTGFNPVATQYPAQASPFVVPVPDFSTIHSRVAGVPSNFQLKGMINRPYLQFQTIAAWQAAGSPF